jgi:hypothetical protein
MPINHTNKEIDDFLRDILIKDGYKINAKKGLGKLSSDIKATKDGEAFYIEIAALTETMLLNKQANYP